MTRPLNVIKITLRSDFGWSERQITQNLAQNVVYSMGFFFCFLKRERERAL